MCLGVKISYSNIPDIAIGEGTISVLFKAVGLKSFHQACDYVWRLPYGRTSEPYQFKTVLSESRGTCSSKHALLKLLADENGVEVELVVGLYPMKESNTPGVGVVLDKYGYKFIPEAHCYLNFRGSRVDLTRFGSEAVEEINDFFIEVPVRPQKLAKVKPEMHRQFLVEKYGEGQVASVWQIREECIAALST